MLGFLQTVGGMIAEYRQEKNPESDGEKIITKQREFFVCFFKRKRGSRGIKIVQTTAVELLMLRAFLIKR